MEGIFVYAGIGFLTGVVISFIFALFIIMRLKKSNKSLQGFLESEKLRKETLQKENKELHEVKRVYTDLFDKKIKELTASNKRLDEDILLLQQSNEETEALLKEGMPVVHTLKLQLIEANNSIARYKSQIEKTSVNNAR